MAEPRVPEPGAASSRRLNSWKEIATHFSRDVRTVRRWEANLGLPVHRRQHMRRGIVYAYQAELDAWWKDGHKRLEKAGENVLPGRRLPVAPAAVAGVLLLLAGAYFTWRYSRGQIAAEPFAVTKTTRLTSDGRANKAAISPDGRYVVHTQVTSGQQSLLVRRSDALHDIEVVPPGSPYFMGITFSPDSETIYYVTGTTGGAPSILYRIPVMGGTAQKLKLAVDSPVTFSPDGKRYAFVREAAGESTLMVADLGSGSEQRLFSRKLPLVLDYPAWSPDGGIIACTIGDSSSISPAGSEARIIGVRLADRTERTLAKRTWPFIRQLAWLTNGHGLVMSARDQETGTFHVWYVAYPSGIARKVTEGLNSETGVSVSADSNHLLTVEERTLGGIWLMHGSESQDPQPVSHDSENCKVPAWGADGRIVYEQQLNNQRNIWSIAADGTERKQLTLAGSSYDPSTSADGRTLAFVSDRTGDPAIWTMDIDGGNPSMVLKTDSEPYPALSPDGKWIAFTATGAGFWPTLRRVASNGGSAVELNDRLWLQPAISPDGKWIAGFYVDHPSGTQKYPDSIAVISSDGGRLRQVIPIADSVSTSAGIRWSPDGRQLTYVEHREEGANIWSRPWDGGAPHRMTKLRGYTLFSFAWSADGKQLALSRGIQASDVVLIDSARSSR